MRRSTLQAAIDAATTRVEILDVVRVLDYAENVAVFEKQERAIATQHAEIATLRMLLRESVGQLDRLYATTKTTSADYRRLVDRVDKCLAHTTLEQP